MLRAYLRRKFATLSETDDVVQESYLRLFRAKAAGTLRSVRGFLFTVARHAAIDVFRQRQTVSFDDVIKHDALSVLDDRPGVAETVCRKQELGLLAEAIESLPPRCRQVIKLRKIYGLSHKEIAVRLGIAEGTVNVQVGRGMRRCIEFLEARGVIVTARHDDER